DFTRTMAARVLESQGYVFERTELEAPQLVARTIQQCELAKRRLSSQEQASVRVASRSGELSEQSPVVAVARSVFESWTGHILARVELPIRRVLGDAGLRREDVHEVILVGGATRMPAVVDLVTRMFGKQPRNRINPDEVVALGAAVQAGLVARQKSVEDLVVTDVCPFTLGVEISKQFGLEHRPGYFLPIIDRNTTIPVSRVHRLSTLEANQTQVVVKLYQGESRRIEGNLFISEFTVTGIPRAPAGQAIDVRFTYDLNGVLEAEATVVETAATFRHVVTRYARGLTPEQIARAVEQMAQIKTHPREEAANRFLLQRAERVYRELSLEVREMLGRLLDGFEEALGMNDAEAIARHRQALTEFLDRCETHGHDEFKADDDSY
ncbi:MAG TPA: Hsp70 family protein, partial [Pirellulales bacterium]|nr:Hsp70 family protein [Pirellulales bacterium]